MARGRRIGIIVMQNEMTLLLKRADRIIWEIPNGTQEDESAVSAAERILSETAGIRKQGELRLVGEARAVNVQGQAEEAVIYLLKGNYEIIPGNMISQYVWAKQKNAMVLLKNQGLGSVLEKAYSME